jgi:hypothetical protein
MWSSGSALPPSTNFPLSLLITAKPYAGHRIGRLSTDRCIRTCRQFCCSLLRQARHHDKLIFHLDDNGATAKSCHFAPAIDQLCMIDLCMTNTFWLPNLYAFAINRSKNGGISAFLGHLRPAEELTQL